MIDDYYRIANWTRFNKGTTRYRTWSKCQKYYSMGKRSYVHDIEKCGWSSKFFWDKSGWIYPIATMQKKQRQIRCFFCARGLLSQTLICYMCIYLCFVVGVNQKNLSHELLLLKNYWLLVLRIEHRLNQTYIWLYRLNY